MNTKKWSNIAKGTLLGLTLMIGIGTMTAAWPSPFPAYKQSQDLLTPTDWNAVVDALQQSKNDITTLQASSSGSGVWSVSDTNVYRSVGNVGIGTTSPSKKLEVAGEILATGYFHSSDRRLKDNIKLIDGLTIVSGLNGVTFDWKSNGQSAAGVIAQDVETVLPQSVTTDADGYKAVDYDALTGVLIEAIKQQQTQIEKLQADIDALKQAL